MHTPACTHPHAYTYLFCEIILELLDDSNLIFECEYLDGSPHQAGETIKQEECTHCSCI